MSSVAVKRPPDSTSSSSLSQSTSSLSRSCTSQHRQTRPELRGHEEDEEEQSPFQTDREELELEVEKEEERDDVEKVKRSTRSPSSPPGYLYTEESLQRRLTEALRDRDTAWMKHEKAQIAFLQTESASMLRGLHAEMERLSIRLREARRLADVGHCSSEKEMMKELQARQQQVALLEAALHEKEQRVQEMETRVAATLERMTEQINLQADRIRQLNSELHDRTQTVAQLSSQLRAYRLKEAMALAQQRRRVSNASASSPLVSPSSPHRSFPPFSTYPGSSGSQSARVESTRRSESDVHPPSTTARREKIDNKASVLSFDRTSLTSSNNIDERPKLRTSARRPHRSNSAMPEL